MKTVYNSHKIGFLEKIGFATYSTASNVIFNFVDLFYLFFLTNVMGIEIAHAGIILGIGILWDAINDPLVGFWSINHRFKSGEFCRPLAITCAVPWALTTVLMFTCFEFSYAVKLVGATLIYLLFELVNTLGDIPYTSMAGLATTDDAERRSINVYRNIGAGVGSAIGSVALYPLLNLFGGLDADGNILPGKLGQASFFKASIIIGIVCILGCSFHYFTTKERIKPISAEKTKIKVSEVVRVLLGCRSWVMNMLFVVCYNMLNLLVMSTINYYATYVIGSSASATPILATYLVISLVASIVSIPIDKALGRRKTMILATIIHMLGKIWFMMNPYSLAAVYVNAACVGFSIALAYVAFNTNRNSIADLLEAKSGKRIDGIVATSENFISKLSKAIVNLLMTTTLSIAGFNAELSAQPIAAIRTLNALLGIVPFFVAIGMFFVAYFHPIEKEVAEMNASK